MYRLRITLLSSCLFLLSSVVATGMSQGVAQADTHSHPRVIKKRSGKLNVKMTLAKKRPTAGDEVSLFVDLALRGHHHDETTAVGDAKIHVHVGHGDDMEEFSLVSDPDASGSYSGKIKFDHSGKEAVKVTITLSSGKEHNVSFRLNVKSTSKHQDE